LFAQEIVLTLTFYALDVDTIVIQDVDSTC